MHLGCVITQIYEIKWNLIKATVSSQAPLLGFKVRLPSDHVLKIEKKQPKKKKQQKMLKGKTFIL